jgi:hypothetical protein
MAKGEFFAIGKGQWEMACARGIAHAATLLVLARGSGPDNSTTSWSADAVWRHTGLAWRRASSCINDLMRDGVIVRLKAGKRPTYCISRPDEVEDMIWLPNTLVTGAGSEIPPVARLRQAQCIEYMQAFIELYSLHDLASDSGLPRSLLYGQFQAGVELLEFGAYRVLGFTRCESHCHRIGPFKRFAGQKVGDRPRSWHFIDTMEAMGLMERTDHLAESDDAQAELIHALSGDIHAEATAREAATFADNLPGGFKFESARYDYVVPVLNHLQKAAVVGVFRLTYRPRTSRTSMWFARHVEASQRYQKTYRDLCAGLLRAAA